MSEEFIRREYGAFTNSKSLSEARSQRRKTNLILKKNKNRDSLQEQLATMRAKREAYEKIKEAGIIKTTKEGRDLISGNIFERQRKVAAKMRTLSDRQLDVLSGLVEGQGDNARNWFERQREKINKERNTQAMLLNFSAKDLYKQILQTGEPLFDNKGFDLDVSMDKIGFQYRVDF